MRTQVQQKGSAKKPKPTRHLGHLSGDTTDRHINATETFELLPAEAMSPPIRP